jgi:hypothetical protein
LVFALRQISDDGLLISNAGTWLWAAAKESTQTSRLWLLVWQWNTFATAIDSLRVVIANNVSHATFLASVGQNFSFAERQNIESFN